MSGFFRLSIISALVAACLPAQTTPEGNGVVSWRYLEAPAAAAHRAAARSTVTEQERGSEYLNALRTGAGLIALTYNSKLQDASQSHADYLISQNTFGHYETNESDPYYTGYYPWDRGSNAGYDWRTYSENISGGDNDVIESIDGLMTAIYHRFGFLGTRVADLGIGIASDSGYVYGSAYVYDMGNEEDPSQTAGLNPAVVLWPYSGYDSAQTSFFNTESPDPLPQCARYGVAGNPVSVVFNPEKSGDVSAVSFRLYGPDGNELTDTVVLDENSTPSVGEGRFALFSLHGLHVDSRYRAVFDYTEDGTAKTLEWRFNTRRYDYKRYEAVDGGTYDIVSGKTYIIQVRPDDCNTSLRAYSYSYSGSLDLQRLQMDLLQVTATGDVHFSFDSGKVEFDLKIADTDNAVPPSLPDGVRIQPALHYLLF